MLSVVAIASLLLAWTVLQNVLMYANKIIIIIIIKSSLQYFPWTRIVNIIVT